MFQVTFSDQCISELDKLDSSEQMQLLNQLTNLSPDKIKGNKSIKSFQRENKIFYRLRAGEFRIYFEIQGDTLHADFILHRKSLADFIFRCKLPINQESLAEQHQSFWQYLESLKK